MSFGLLSASRYQLCGPAAGPKLATETEAALASGQAFVFAAILGNFLSPCNISVDIKQQLSAVWLPSRLLWICLS